MDSGIFFDANLFTRNIQNPFSLNAERIKNKKSSFLSYSPQTALAKPKSSLFPGSRCAYRVLLGFLAFPSFSLSVQFLCELSSPIHTPLPKLILSQKRLERFTHTLVSLVGVCAYSYVNDRCELNL